jgi:putative intracellular protease/amidase
MHEEKIWAMDFSETLETNDADRPNLMMITGGSDSKIKLWHDSTVQEEIRQRTEKLGSIQDE